MAAIQRAAEGIPADSDGPWFDDGSLSVTLQARYYWSDAAQAHREVERGHTQGKIALIVDDDLAASLGV